MKIIFVVTVDYYFCSHRLALATAARDAGCEVAVVTQVTSCQKLIRDTGIRVIPIRFSRASLDPLLALRIIRELVVIYRRERPTLVHHVGMKPVLFGSVAACLAGSEHVVSLIAGRGWLFTSRSPLARVLRPFVKVAFRFLLRIGRVVVQNPDDAALMRSMKLENVSVVPGSGVDPAAFAPHPEPSGDLTVMFVGRLLLDKGVAEFIHAATLLRQTGNSARFILIGAPDDDSRSSISRDQLLRWKREGIVEVWGKRKDIASVLAQGHIACLPSYSEGIPKALLEAAACGLPLVATDVPGCREVVIDGENGFLVPTRNAAALADALKKLLDSPDLRRTMGARSRQLVLEKFTTQHVIDATFAIYREVLASAGLSFPPSHEQTVPAHTAAEAGSVLEERRG